MSDKPSREVELWKAYAQQTWDALLGLVDKGASDIIIAGKVGAPHEEGIVQARIDGSMQACFEVQHPAALIRETLSAKPVLAELCNRIADAPEIDAACVLTSTSGRRQRFRLNAAFARGILVGSYRPLADAPPSPESIGLDPALLERFFAGRSGLILLSGQTGSGKTTTLAAMLEWVNQRYPWRIYTIEDPIEFTFKNDQSIFQQREVGTDTLSFPAGMRSALRCNPNIVLVGEMRDLETMRAAFTMAETGHIVLATVHAGNVEETVPRMVRQFPPEEQEAARMVIGRSLIAIIAQQLLPKRERGRVAWREILTAEVPAVRATIDQGTKYSYLNHIMNTSRKLGMTTFAAHLDTIRDQLDPDIYRRMRKASAATE